MSSIRDTIVEEGSTLRGSLASRGRILVMGRLDGDIDSPAVEVTETGALSGTIKAGVLRSRGALGGLLEANEIDLGGRVLDETVIRARDLAVALGSEGEGAQFGDCEIVVGDEPDRERAVSDAQAPARGLFDPDGA
ncbi:MAG TPA: polymer-forming cytoskeletal protein [Polyangia bacterium]|nr:polymer-forming cytoskeletal protein [Polyangia bacterium]